MIMSEIDEARARSKRLVAASPCAVPLDKAVENIRARRAQLIADAQRPQSPAQEENFSTPEPMPPNIVDNPGGFGKDFWTRLAAKDKPPPRGSKPRVIVNNDAKRKKKPGKDDDPEPPKAA